MAHLRFLGSLPKYDPELVLRAADDLFVAFTGRPKPSGRAVEAILRGLRVVSYDVHWRRTATSQGVSVLNDNCQIANLAASILDPPIQNRYSVSQHQHWGVSNAEQIIGDRRSFDGYWKGCKTSLSRNKHSFACPSVGCAVCGLLMAGWWPAGSVVIVLGTLGGLCSRGRNQEGLCRVCG